MEEKTFIFLAGLHRSGTSLLHEIIREHPQISGFSDTGVPEDEGQHLQSVYKAAKDFGGAGRFVFDSKSYMDESHPLATYENADNIFRQWSNYWDLSCKYLIEKSPPNIVRTRFLQKLFPKSKFIVILRHPLAVSYATEKWSKTSISLLLEHTLLAYEIFRKDLSALNSVYILRYEEFVFDPQKTINDIYSFLGVEPVRINQQVRGNVNEKYFAMWESDKKNWLNRIVNRLPRGLEKRANEFGYSIKKHKNGLIPIPWLCRYNKSHFQEG